MKRLFVPIIIVCLGLTPIRTSANSYVATPDYIEEEIYADSLELLACLVFCEAGNQTELGKKLVCDTVLNRVDDPRFPDNIYDVITQKGQFSPVTSGKIYTCNPTQECFDAVSAELKKRTNREVLFFRTGHYHEGRTNLFKEDDHYFSR